MLYAFGDSYTFGQGLPDMVNMGDRVIGSPEETSKHVWPVHLAKLLNTEVENHSHGGASMLSITKMFMENFHKLKQDDIVVVAWTYLDRWSIVTPEDIPVFNLLPNMKRIVGMPTLEDYLPFNNNKHKITMFCMLSTLIASLCELKGARFYQRAIERTDIRTFKIHKPDWYDLYLPVTGLLSVNGKKSRIEKVLGLKIDKNPLPDRHNNEDTHIFWAHSIHKEITRSLSA